MNFNKRLLQNIYKKQIKDLKSYLNLLDKTDLKTIYLSDYYTLLKLLINC